MTKRIASIATVCLIGIAACLILVSHRHSAFKHIILISMDTTRADHLGCYGYPKNTTPYIDAFATQATRFEHAISPAPITLPAHSSMLTGKVPPSHGVRNNTFFRLDPSVSTLAEILPDEFISMAVVSSFVLDRQFGLAQGFDSYDDGIKEYAPSIHGIERRASETTKVALEWLEECRDGRSFLFLHYFDPHMDYRPPEPFASAFPDDPYAGEIAFVDDCVGQVIQKLKEQDIYDSSLIIITGDHGEMLGEHGENTHSYFIYEPAIRIPLIVKLPGQKKGSIVSEKVGLIDLVPTICALLNIDPPAGIQGKDISPMLHGKVPEGYERYLYSESMVPDRYGASSLLGLTQGKWKYIQAPRPELYDLETDPGEEHNLYDQEYQRVRIMKDRLVETMEQSVRNDTDSHIELDAESIRRLESLGYIAGKSEGEIVFDETKPDPKDLIDVHSKFHIASALIEIKKYESAGEILENLIPLQPEFEELYVRLAEIELVLGKINAAIRHFRIAYVLEPRSISDSHLNDLAWLQATRPSLVARDVDEAVRYAKDACERMGGENPATLDTLAVCYAAKGDFQNAIATARKALAIASMAKQNELAQEIADRLKLFEQSNPYIKE